ncbi:hypothetical protein [uncultured Vagococcus sp.]|uniref:hypothetical protein n=1 Tax=uncultured Vagococcus sp. TaxID=189676 RepID=UPI0028D1A231|nr:hypothetical protein [uncultured Vagococcus sp.]
MKKIAKGYYFKVIQLLLTSFLIGQYIPVTVQAVDSVVEDMTLQPVAPLYTYSAVPDSDLRDHLPKLLKDLESEDYIIQHPVKLYSVTSVEITEDAYYPVMVDQQLKTLIRYNSKADLYVLEKPETVEMIRSHKESLTDQDSLLFIDLEGIIVGKSQDSVTNFSETGFSEIDNLVTKINVSELDLGKSINMFSDNEQFFESKSFKNSETNTFDSFEEQPIVATSSSTRQDKTDTSTTNLDLTVKSVDEQTSSTNNSSKKKDDLKESLDTLDSSITTTYSSSVENKSLETPSTKSDPKEAGPSIEHAKNMLAMKFSFDSPEEAFYGTKDYTSGLTNSDVYLSGSYIRSNNNYYVVEKTKEGAFRYANTGYLALYGQGSGLYLEWWSGRTNIPNRSIELKPEFKEYYKEATFHPWTGRDMNYIMRWLNHWSTSEFMIVKSGDIADDVWLLSKNDAEIVPSLNDKYAYKQISRKKETDRYGTKDYISGLSNSHVYLSGSYIKSTNNYYVVEKTKEGAFRYANTGYLALYGQGSGLYLEWWSGRTNIPNRSIELKPEFKEYYKEATVHPWTGRDMNYIMRWLNYWSTSEFMIVKSGDIADDVWLLSKNDAEIVPSLNNKDAYKQISRKKETDRYGTKDYTSGLTNSDVYLSGSYIRSNNNYYVVEKTKEGAFRYANTGYLALYGQGSGLYLEWWSGRTNIPNRSIELKPEFKEYYKEATVHPWTGRDMNYIMRWLNHWSTSEFMIVKSGDIADDVWLLSKNDAEIVPSLNDKYAYKQISRKKETDRYGTKDYISGLSNSHVYLSGSYIKSTNNYYVVEKTKEGAFRYANTGYLALYGQGSGLYLEWWSGRTNIPNRSIELKPEFKEYYKEATFHPWTGRDMNYIMRWLNHWSTSEFMIVKSENIAEVDLATAKKNQLVTPWHFYETGRTSKKNQYYSLSLPETTRLNIDLTGSYKKNLTVYNKEEKKVFSTAYSSGKASEVLDLPAGEYYVILTGITSETAFQMKRSQFKDWQLSIDTNKDRTHIYVGGHYNQALTDLYAPYHNSTLLPTVVQVTNTLSRIWKQSYGRYPVLDTIFGTDYLLSAPSLTQPTLTSLGYVPLGSQIFTFPIQYVGQGQFYSNKQLFNPMIGPQQRFVIVDDLLFWIAVAGVTIAYSAYVANTNNLTLTMPSFLESDAGSWEDLDDYGEEMNQVMANPKYKDNTNIDCSEIAEDFAKVNPKGTVYNVMAEDGGKFSVLEYGRIRSDMDYHMVFSYRGLIYDPRYASVPIVKDQYFRELQSLNIKKLHVYEIQL